jgi:hypothetical protein
MCILVFFTCAICLEPGCGPGGMVCGVCTPVKKFSGPLEILREKMLCLIPGEVLAIDSRQPEELGSKICLILR